MLQSYYEEGIVSKYYGGCIYVRDVLHCVKYDIKNGVVSDVDEAEEEIVFTRGYSFTTSADDNVVTITKLDTNETKTFSLEAISLCSEGFSEVINQFKDKEVPFNGVKMTDRAFNDMRVREVDGQLFVTIHLSDMMGNPVPVTFKYEFESNSFEFCVAGGTNTSSVPIPIFD